MGAFLTAAPGILSGIGSLFGGGNKQRKWQQNALVNVLNKMEQAYKYGTGKFEDFSDPLSMLALQSSDWGKNLLFGDVENGGMVPWLEQGREASSPEAMLANYSDPSRWMSPEMQEAVAKEFGLGDTMQGLAGDVYGSAQPTSQLLQMPGLNAVGSGQLLDPREAANFAGEQALRHGQDQAEAARRQAYARGGEAGSVVGGGAANDAMADFSDQVARNVSDARINALMGQQGLVQRQHELGAQMAEGGGALGLNAGRVAGDIFGTAGNLYGSVAPWMLQGAANVNQNVESGFQNTMGLADFYNKIFSQGWNPLTALSGQSLDYARTGVAGLPSIFGGNFAPSQGSPWSSLLGAVGAVGEGIKGAWGKP